MAELIDKMQERAEAFTPEELEQVSRRAKMDKFMAGDSPTKSEEEVKKVAAQPMQESLVQ